MIQQPIRKIRHIARSIGKIDRLVEMLETLQSQAGSVPQHNANSPAATAPLNCDTTLFMPHDLPQAYGDDITAVTIRMMANRDKLLKSYIRAGRGIEIGALHNPAAVPAGVKVLYVDYMPVAELRVRYKELAELNLVEPDIIDDGERLTKVEFDDLDFVIANHFIEHCQNPIMTLESMLSKLKLGGIIFMAVPDKRYTFDALREITTFGHLVRDYEEGPEWSHLGHYKELAKATCHINERTPEQQFEHFYNNVQDIHFHVWDHDAFYEFIVATKRRYGLPLEILLHIRNGFENICVMQKQA